MSVLQKKHSGTKLFESEKCMDEEYTAASREISRLPKYFIQYWIDTGHLPPQFSMNAVVHSDTDSSLSEKGSFSKQSTICNTMLKDKLNNKQLCNNGSSNSSVDTVAYVLSNTNVTKKENIYPRFFKKDEVLTIHKDINYKNNEINTSSTIYDTADSNISNKKYAFDMYSTNEMYQKDKELEETNIVERIELNLPAFWKEDVPEMYKNDNKINKDDLNCQNKEFVENSIDKAENITKVNKNNALLEDSCNHSVRHIRQKKLYAGRESPIDINMTESSKSIDTDINEEKRNLHPAYRNSPLLNMSYRKYVSKKRKYNFFLKTSRSDSQEDTSSNNDTNDNIDVEIHHTKRRKSLENPTNDADETQFFPSISQISEKDKLRQSCREMEKQIKRFPIAEFHENVGHKHNLRQKITKEKTDVRIISRDTLNKKHNPVVFLERLSEKVIKRYTNKKGLQSKKTKRSSTPVKSRSIISENTKPRLRLRKTIVHIGNSDTSTIIINKNMNSESSNNYDYIDPGVVSNSTSLSNSGNMKKNQLKTLSNDVKLTQMRPVVLLERLHYTGSSSKKPLCRLNNLKNKLQPIVVLERFINVDRNSNHTINKLACNKSNKTKAKKIKSSGTNKRIDRNYKRNTKLQYFETNMSSDSDPDVSFTKCTFNLNTTMKYNSENKTNQKSFNSLKIDMPENLKNMEDKETSFLKRKNFDNKHMSLHNFNVYMSTNNERSFPAKVSYIGKEDNPLNNLNKSVNNEKIHALTNMQLTSDASGKDKSTLQNSANNTANNTSNNTANNTAIVDANENKKHKLVFVTKVYDSDSD